MHNVSSLMWKWQLTTIKVTALTKYHLTFPLNSFFRAKGWGAEAQLIRNKKIFLRDFILSIFMKKKKTLPTGIWNSILTFSCSFTRELLLQPFWDSLKWENPFEHISNMGFSDKKSTPSLVWKTIERKFSRKSSKSRLSRMLKQGLDLKASGLQLTLFHKIVYYANESILWSAT